MYTAFDSVKYHILENVVSVCLLAVRLAFFRFKHRLFCDRRSGRLCEQLAEEDSLPHKDIQ